MQFRFGTENTRYYAVNDEAGVSYFSEVIR